MTKSLMIFYKYSGVAVYQRIELRYAKQPSVQIPCIHNVIFSTVNKSPEVS